MVLKIYIFSVKKVFAISEILADYLEIYIRYPADAFLNKAQRKARHCELTKWAKQEYHSMPDIEEIIAFVHTNDSLKYEQPFFLKVVAPCVRKDIKEGSIQAIRFVFECNGKDNDRVSTTRDYVWMLYSETDFPYTPTKLANMVLSKEPDNEFVLYYKYWSIKRQLEFSIHELPSGILCGMNGAEKEHLPHMKENLRTFFSISKKLFKDDNSLIQICTTMYTAWEQYLDYIESYGNFEDYLMKHNITY